MVIDFEVYLDFNYLISTQINDKRKENSKSGHPFSSRGTKFRKIAYDLIKVHWRRMTSVNLGKVTMLVQTMHVTS